MKQIWPNYSYSPATNVLTLTGLNIDRDQLLLVTAADRGRIMYNFADSSVTASAFTSGANTALTLVATTAGLTTTAALVIYYDDQLTSTTVTISSLPAISGTVTANIGSAGRYDNGGDSLRMDLMVVRGQDAALFLREGGGNVPISGTVTIGSALPTGTNRIGVVTIGGGTVTIGAGTAQIGSVTAFVSDLANVTEAVDEAINQSVIAIHIKDLAGNVLGTSVSPMLISGTVTANPTGTQTIAGSVTLGAGTAQIGSVTASISSLPAISGTVTANSSNGSLTTRFGSVTTANTAFATSAVTNTNRKYLLIQNVTTASNVITVGIGFTPTTTQGIQLSSGAGLTFEGSYIPTGAVNLLSSVTASCFTILEA